MKQLYDPLTAAEIRAMGPRDRADRLALCEHQLANKARALEMFSDPKPYMFAEVAGLRSNIEALKRAS